MISQSLLKKVMTNYLKHLEEKAVRYYWFYITRHLHYLGINILLSSLFWSFMYKFECNISEYVSQGLAPYFHVVFRQTKD